MPNQTLLQILNARVQDALAAAGCTDATANVQPASRPEHGDYQANGIMAAAKARKLNPHALAQTVVDHLKLDGIVSHVEIAGPGFINMTVAPDYLASWVRTALDDHGGLAVPRATEDAVQCVVIDYSSPNLAKEMHVGHLRSTVIGDALARVLRFVGHKVVAQNHVGDWGTQFGMLTACMDEAGPDDASNLALADLEVFYRNAKKRFDEDAAFANRARDYVVKLQGGDARVLELWKRFLDVSMSHCEEIYRKLSVGLTPADVHGESAYNDDLPVVVADLQAKGLAVTSDGAQVVFLDEFSSKDGVPAAYIVQKQDGGYLYSTTDLAAIRYRATTLKANRMLYVVDARQKLHFQQVFSVARKAGYVPADVQLEHVGFGVVLGGDGKPFKTRSGDTVKLAELLAEATQRAFNLVTEKSPELPEADRRAVAQIVGIGAIKYFDLAKNRSTDYVFDWSSMLSFEGNTAPYLQYAYTRIKSVLRRAGDWDVNGKVHLADPAERQLALQLARFSDAVLAVAQDALPNYLCAYLYELAAALMRFYEACPVVSAAGETRTSRLQLCRLTADTLRTGLGLLGIEVLEAM
ncbi:arginyl-tRNA synthetase [Paraburkholderia sp. EB58]|jgi:arginyl-tRNA synthetase|uniref:arginine--tRNA ligase n=1 Tax=Paraburkholderia sp. EB58 TaxID=3035125 RepID=UPI003D1FFE93